MKAAIYARVSTAEQSTDNQLPDLEALASRRGFDIVRVFSENVSAVKARPEFDVMIAAAHRGKFDVLLVWSLDRLHRSMVGALQTVLDLDRRGVQVVSQRALARHGRSGAELAHRDLRLGRRAGAAPDR